MSNNVEWYDYEKQESLQSPPIGEDVEIVRAEMDGDNAYVVKVLFVGESLILILDGGVEIAVRIGLYKFRPLDWDKNIKVLERIKVIDAAVELLGALIPCSEVALIALYNAGMLKLPEDKGH